MLFENKYFLKLYRKLEDGVNPDVEITQFLTERRDLRMCPRLLARWNIGEESPHRRSFASCKRRANEGDVWALTLDAVGRYYERVLGRKADLQMENAPTGALLTELIGGVFPQKAKLLGQRTGELHLALASDLDDPAFAPEPFNALSQRSVYQNMRASVRRSFALLQKKLPDFPESFRDEAEEVLAGGAQDPRAGTAHSRSTSLCDQDSDPRRLSPGTGCFIPGKILSFSISKASQRAP